MTALIVFFICTFNKYLELYVVQWIGPLIFVYIEIISWQIQKIYTNSMMILFKRKRWITLDDKMMMMKRKHSQIEWKKLNKIYSVKIGTVFAWLVWFSIKANTFRYRMETAVDALCSYQNIGGTVRLFATDSVLSCTQYFGTECCFDLNTENQPFFLMGQKRVVVCVWFVRKHNFNWRTILVSRIGEHWYDMRMHSMCLSSFPYSHEFDRNTFCRPFFGSEHDALDVNNSMHNFQIFKPKWSIVHS